MNAALEKLGGKERLDVENVEGREEVIEMDIALVQVPENTPSLACHHAPSPGRCGALPALDL